MGFDPNEFMSSTIDAPLATAFEVCPEGEFPFMLDSDPKWLTPKELSGISQKSGQPYHFWQMELSALCMDEAVKAKLGRDRVPVRLRINLDLDSAGRIETGANKSVALGRLLAALGQNRPGWNVRDLLGAGPFIGKVKHSSNKDDPTVKYADIVNTAKVS